MKFLVIFDLDGTLAKSKAALDPEMAMLLGRLLQHVKVAVISGGAWTQFQKQVLARLRPSTRLERLSILPTSGTQFYAYDRAWRQLYSEDFTREEKSKIVRALERALAQSGFHEARRWGEVIQDRGSQITFSALGQEAPSSEKRNWDPDFVKRKRIQARLKPLIPEFSVQLGGSTSIDITKPGIDKGYGVRKLRDTLGIPFADMLFVGDAISRGQRLSGEGGGGR
jgi:HAD superfamily hydrolase (TIGR01484 family)